MIPKTIPPLELFLASRQSSVQYGGSLQCSFTSKITAQIRTCTLSATPAQLQSPLHGGGSVFLSQEVPRTGTQHHYCQLSSSILLSPSLRWLPGSHISTDIMSSHASISPPLDTGRQSSSISSHLSLRPSNSSSKAPSLSQELGQSTICSAL